MANWEKIQALPEAYQRKIMCIYSHNQAFPFEIRKNLAVWIEQQDWSFYCNPNTTYDKIFLDKCILLLQSFIKEVDQLLANTIDISDKFKFENFHCKLQLSLGQKNYEIIKQINECLRSEAIIIQRYQEGINEVNPDHFHQLEVNCQSNKDKILFAEGLLKNMNNCKENLTILHSSFNSLKNVSHSTIQTQQMIESRQAKLLDLTNQINYLCTYFKQCKEEFLIKHKEIIQELESIFFTLQGDLNVWKNSKKDSIFTNEWYDNFRQITEICQLFASNICLMWPQIKKIEALLIDIQVGNSIPENHCVEMKTKIIGLLKNLVNQTFIVEQQPCQVIKTNTKLKKIAVNLLVGNIFKNHINPSVVKVSIINENQAKQLYKDPNNFRVDTCSGEILNNTTVMEYNSSSKILSANFINLQLKRIKRTEKKASESVMDEKSALLFTTEFFIEEDLRFSVKTISDPVVVIVHVNQEAHAQATITWDTAFAEPTRCPFEVPQEVQFARLASVLSQKFFENTGRGLSEDNITFLSEKIFGTLVPLSSMVSWTKFSKEHIPGQTFTFWDWFYAILKLTTDHLRDIWRDGHIIGFLTRPRAEELLSSQAFGTFLLRFSDTKLGGISIAYVEPNNLEKKVIMVDPFCSNDLKLRKLPDRLHDFDHLTFLFPNTPKDDAFSHYYTQVNNQNQTSNGYVLPILVNFIPRVPSNNSPSSDYSFQSQFSNNFQMDMTLPSFDMAFENSFVVSPSNDGMFEEDY